MVPTTNACLGVSKYIIVSLLVPAVKLDNYFLVSSSFWRIFASYLRALLSKTYKMYACMVYKWQIVCCNPVKGVYLWRYDRDTIIR